MSTFLPTSGFKWINPKDFGSINYSCNTSKGCVLEFDFEYPEELHDYPIVPDKIEIKREMLSKYQLNVADFYNIPIGAVKKLVSNFFDKDKYLLHYLLMCMYIRFE